MERFHGLEHPRLGALVNLFGVIDDQLYRLKGDARVGGDIFEG